MIYTMKVIFLKCPISMFSLFWNVSTVELDLTVNEQKMALLKRKKFVQKKNVLLIL